MSTTETTNGKGGTMSETITCPNCRTSGKRSLGQAGDSDRWECTSCGNRYSTAHSDYLDPDTPLKPMSETKHPRMLKAEHLEPDSKFQLVFEDKPNDPIADVYDWRVREFIQTACNAHDELVEELERASRIIGNCQRHRLDDGLYDACDAFLIDAQATIAKAKP